MQQLHTKQVARALNAVAQIKPAVGAGGIAPVHGTDLRKPGLPLLRKIPVIPTQQCLGTVWYQVNLPVKLLGLARLQSAHARIVVPADDYALKQFLSLVPGHGQQIITVCRKTADKTVDRFIEADGARVHVLEIDSSRNVNLTAVVNRFFGSTRFVERGQSALCEDKTFVDVVGLITSGKAVHPHARLEPLQVHKLIAAVLQCESKIYVIPADANVVQNFNLRLHDCPKLEAPAFPGGGKQFCFVRNGGLAPIAMRRAAAAKGFEIPDVHLAAWNVETGNSQHVVGPGDGQATRRSSRDGRKAGQ